MTLFFEIPPFFLHVSHVHYPNILNEKLDKKVLTGSLNKMYNCLKFLSLKNLYIIN